MLLFYTFGYKLLSQYSPHEDYVVPDVVHHEYSPPHTNLGKIDWYLTINFT